MIRGRQQWSKISKSSNNPNRFYYLYKYGSEFIGWCQPINYKPKLQERKKNLKIGVENLKVEIKCIKDMVKHFGFIVYGLKEIMKIVRIILLVTFLFQRALIIT